MSVNKIYIPRADGTFIHSNSDFVSKFESTLSYYKSAVGLDFYISNWNVYYDSRYECLTHECNKDYPRLFACINGIYVALRCSNIEYHKEDFDDYINSLTESRVNDMRTQLSAVPDFTLEAFKETRSDYEAREAARKEAVRKEELAREEAAREAESRRLSKIKSDFMAGKFTSMSNLLDLMRSTPYWKSLSIQVRGMLDNGKVSHVENRGELVYKDKRYKLPASFFKAVNGFYEYLV